MAVAAHRSLTAHIRFALRCLYSHFRPAALLLVVPASSFAGTSAPFDIGASILWIGGYLIGFLALLSWAFYSKRARLALILYVSAPVALMVFDLYAERRALAEAEAGRTANDLAFQQYCKDRKVRVLERIHLEPNLTEEDRSILVRFESNFHASRDAHNAAIISYHLRANPAVCALNGLDVLVLKGYYGGEYTKGGDRFTEVWRLDACRQAYEKVVTDNKARYELVFGETGRKDRGPWGGQWEASMWNSSIQIIDKRNSRVLAEDTLYFFRDQSGVGECPDAAKQAADLVVEVFGVKLAKP